MHGLSTLAFARVPCTQLSYRTSLDLMSLLIWIPSNRGGAQTRSKESYVRSVSLDSSSYRAQAVRAETYLTRLLND